MSLKHHGYHFKVNYYTMHFPLPGLADNVKYETNSTLTLEQVGINASGYQILVEFSGGRPRWLPFDDHGNGDDNGPSFFISNAVVVASAPPPPALVHFPGRLAKAAAVMDAADAKAVAEEGDGEEEKEMDAAALMEIEDSRQQLASIPAER